MALLFSSLILYLVSNFSFSWHHPIISLPDKNFTLSIDALQGFNSAVSIQCSSKNVKTIHCNYLSYFFIQNVWCFRIETDYIHDTYFFSKLLWATSNETRISSIVLNNTRYVCGENQVRHLTSNEKKSIN